MIVLWSEERARYEAITSFFERSIPKEERWRWDPDRKRWFTRSDDIAKRLARYATGAAALLGLPFDPRTLEVVAGHAGPAYGVPHTATLEALRLAARQEALVLDPVYSAKGLAGLIALLQAGRWRADQHVVFIHTGGAPSLFAHEGMA